MIDPFKINARTAISVSGGSTSGYMLWRVLQAHGGKLPPDTKPMFANTGKEDIKTLEFVRDMETHWGVPITWVEWRDPDVFPAGFEVVNFETASREGEPFEALIKKRNYLPNPVTRFCTSELKIRAMHRYLRTQGWQEGDDGWDQMVGIRSDEPRRVAKIRKRGTSTESAKETMCLPLADAKITVGIVDTFWAMHPFRLNLARYKGRTLEGNCDLCFLKPPAQRLSLIRAKPGRGVWWARMEKNTVETIKPRYVETGFFDESGEPLLKQVPSDGARFLKDGATYQQMIDFAQNQDDLFDEDEEAIACFCGD